MEVPWKSAKKSRWTLEVSKEVQIVYRLFLAQWYGVSSGLLLTAWKHIE